MNDPSKLKVQKMIRQVGLVVNFVYLHLNNNSQPGKQETTKQHATNLSPVQPLQRKTTL